MLRHRYLKYFLIFALLIQSSISSASWHRIINEATGKCIDAHETLEGKHIKQYDCWGDEDSAPQQFWRFNDDGTIVNKKSGLYIGLDGKQQEISDVIQSRDSGNACARWIYCGDFSIQNQARDCVLEVFFGQPENSRHIGYTSTNFRSSPHARWRVEPFSSEVFVKGFCLRVPINADQCIANYRLYRDRIRKFASELHRKNIALRLASEKRDRIDQEIHSDFGHRLNRGREMLQDVEDTIQEAEKVNKDARKLIAVNGVTCENSFKGDILNRVRNTRWQTPLGKKLVREGQAKLDELKQANSDRDRCSGLRDDLNDSINTAHLSFLCCYHQLKQDYGQSLELDDLALLGSILNED